MTGKHVACPLTAIMLHSAYLSAEGSDSPDSSTALATTKAAAAVLRLERKGAGNSTSWTAGHCRACWRISRNPKTRPCNLATKHYHRSFLAAVPANDATWTFAHTAKSAEV